VRIGSCIGIRRVSRHIFNGSVRVEAVNEERQTFADDLSAGDVWFFHRM